jgi:hypothetical protein
VGKVKNIKKRMISYVSQNNHTATSRHSDWPSSHRSNSRLASLASAEFNKTVVGPLLPAECPSGQTLNSTEQHRRAASKV